MTKWLLVAGGVLFLWKTGRLNFGAAKPKFYMAPRFSEDGRLFSGGDQCYSVEQNTWVDRSSCGRK